MAKGIVKVKAKATGDKVKVKLMAKHIMESGLRKDKKTGEFIPAKFLQKFTVMHANKEVFSANMGTAISKNPYFSFNFVGGQAGDELVMTWVENTGETATEMAKIK